MPANQPPFRVKVWIYPDGNPADPPHLWGESVDISSKVRHPGQDGGQPITYTYGRGDEARNVDASTMSLTLDNRNGEFSTKNVLGAYYGRIRRNTPIVMGTVSAFDTYTRSTVSGISDADSGNVYGIGSYWNLDGSRAVCTFTAANQATPCILQYSGGTDYDAVFTTSIDVVTTGQSVLSAGLQYFSIDSFLMLCAEFGTGGIMYTKILRIYGGGTVVLSASTATGDTYTPNERFKVRYARTGVTLRLKVWKEANPEPAEWDAVCDDDLVLPADLGMYIWRQASNTNVGNVKVYIDDYESTAIEFTGTVVQWPVRWNKAGTNCWAPIQAAGILRRLQQGNPPIDSPLTRQLPAYSPTGYWPLEDASDATVFANVVSKGAPATYTSVAPSSDSTLAGASGSPVFTAAIGAVRAKTALRHASDGFSAMFFTKIASLPATKTSYAYVYATGRVVQWVMSIDSTNSYVDGYDSDGTLVVTSNASFAPVTPTQWVAWQLETQVVGANTEWSYLVYEVGEATTYAQFGSYASAVISHATQLVVGGAAMNGTAVAHLWLGPNTLPFISATFNQVSDGYRGELASDRIARICSEEGIPLVLEDGDSVPLGPQSQNTAMDALRSAESSDYGILYERGAGLGYRPHSARYAQPVLMDLSVSSGQVDDPPDPIDDDQMIRNLWRVDREQGSYAIARDDDHIEREGYYPDQKTINVRGDELLLDHASWCLYIGTRPELRWPGITLNMARNPSLIAAWRKRSFGPRLTITTNKSQVTGSDPDVIAEGSSVTLSPREWKITLNCSGARPFDIGVLDAGIRADAENSTLDVAVATPSATTIQVTNNGDETSTWVPTSTHPSEVPFNINVNGEVMTVTNVGNIFSTTKQTLTVTRGVNGAAKQHAAGLSVTLDEPTYVAL